MKIEIYINDRPIEEFSPEELKEKGKILTQRAMKAAGYIPEKFKTYINDRPIEELSLEGLKEKGKILTQRAMKAAGYIPEK